MAYLILPIGHDFGWGVFGKNFSIELAKQKNVKLIPIPETLTQEAVGNDFDHFFLKKLIISEKELSSVRANAFKVDSTVIHSIAPDFTPRGINLKGKFRIGHAFFEKNILTAEDIFKCAENFDLITTGSSWCEEALRECGLENVRTIIQGVDTNIFNRNYSNKYLFKDKFVVFSGGKFELRKGQDIVIRAYKELQDKYDDVMLVHSWYNKWPASFNTMSMSPLIKYSQPTENHISSVNKILYDNGIDLNRVIGILPLPNHAMPNIYQNTDIGLFPNRCEGGTNLVLMEYMACGKPAIASFNSGHKDILNKDNAILIRNMRSTLYLENNIHYAVWSLPDLDETIDLLHQAYLNRDNLYEKAERAADDMERLTWKDMADQFVDCIQD